MWGKIARHYVFSQRSRIVYFICEGNGRAEILEYYQCINSGYSQEEINNSRMTSPMLRHDTIYGEYSALMPTWTNYPMKKSVYEEFVKYYKFRIQKIKARNQDIKNTRFIAMIFEKYN